MTTRLDIHVGGGFADGKGRILDAVERARRGEVVRADHVTFSSREALAAVMSTKRFEVLRHLHRQPERSVAAFARSLGRDFKCVHEDVEALVGAGLVDRDATGLRTDYDEIRTSIAL